MAELKRCPCCGGKARMKHGKYNLLGAYGTAELDRKWFGVYCTVCEMSQPRRRYDFKEDAIEAWNKRTEPERPKGRWIPVTERLPEKWGEYLVMIEGDKRSTTLHYEWADKYWFDFPNGRKFVVTHWMPLPEPPKED